MKKILTTIIVLLTSAQLFATIRTCNNNNPSPGQYSTLAAAVAASSGGDTIYLSGSNTVYSFNNDTLTKSLTIIGTGFNPQKQNSLISKINNFRLTVNGLNLVGIEVDGNIITGSFYGVLKVIRCKVGNITGSSSLTNNGNLTVESSIISSITHGNSPTNSIVIRNSIVRNRIKLNNFSSNVKIINNAFTEAPVIGFYSLEADAFNDGNAIIKNNIFHNTPTVIGGTQTGTGVGVFTFNISHSAAFPDDDGNNLVGDPLFVNVPYPYLSFSLAHDFHLQPTSPALLNPGDDGLQRGIYGSSPPHTFVPTGMPAIPSIQTMNITPATVNSGQTITINFSSKTNQ